MVLSPRCTCQRDSGWYSPIVWLSQHVGKHLGLGIPKCFQTIQNISDFIPVLIIVYIPEKATEKATYNKKEQHIKPSFPRKATLTCGIVYLPLVSVPKLGIVGRDCSRRSGVTESFFITPCDRNTECDQLNAGTKRGG
jgi:hypothetical protein